MMPKTEVEKLVKILDDLPPYTSWDLGLDPAFDAKVAFRALGAKERLSFLAWAMTLLGLKVLRRADLG
jgi:hypothetical protein